ncbi:transposase ISH11 [Halococcus saccharolyticus DSM 5350]|uniref:Transposase ISH11 n=1 Tax=Halococcus saccharolyticus DSM 5350 TaxID=1227455 RepID=M0MNM1_9EURY|nr:transposase ISH11 [Halococcus saccharolyticus DSM 5350]
MWMIADSAYDTLDWYDLLLDAGVVPIAPYNSQNTDDPLDIEYRVEDRIENHSKDVQLKRSVLDETYNRQTQVERINDAVKNCGLGPVRARGRTTHGRRCSSRCASEWSSRSPTTNKETTRAARCSRHEMGSMTPSCALVCMS